MSVHAAQTFQFIPQDPKASRLKRHIGTTFYLSEEYNRYFLQAQNRFSVEAYQNL